MSHRVIVAQPASVCRQGEGLLQVGVLRFLLPPRRVIVDDTALTYAPIPVMTFVVKVTYSYASCSSPADEMVLAPEPEGLSLDVPSELFGAEPDEIASPSDFVPLRRMVDVLVTGHAFSKRPVDNLPAGFELGTISRSFVVKGERASVRAPLARAAIFGVDGEPAPHVGPRLTPPLQEDYPLGFDFVAFNTAPPSQQLEELSPGMYLTLSGLSERAEKLSLRLPRTEPVMWADTSEERGVPIELSCDMVWIDTDRELLVLTYRMILPIPSIELDGVSQVTVALAREGQAPELAEVQKDLARGAFEAAVELSDFDDDARPPSEEPLFARFAELSQAIPPQISLETYALIAAALAEGNGPREDTLRAYGFDEHRFLIEERGWLTRMAEAAMKEDTTLAARYGELFVKAQDSLQGPGEGQESVLEYASIKVDVEDAADPSEALAARKMTLAQWMRMDRRWARRAHEDRTVELAIERACDEVRANRGEG